jgi:hypothetical protein
MCNNGCRLHGKTLFYLSALVTINSIRTTPLLPIKQLQWITEIFEEINSFKAELKNI